ncbi:MAG: hypothetical protein R3D26_20635 [Cyanobacteriota/Melainabacteria group bacterium]
MTAFPDPEQNPDTEAENKTDEARDEERGFVLERRRYLAPENNHDLDSIVTSSLKRFQKHIASAIKASSKNNREFSLARIDVLEIETWQRPPKSIWLKVSILIARLKYVGCYANPIVCFRICSVNI